MTGSGRFLQIPARVSLSPPSFPSQSGGGSPRGLHLFSKSQQPGGQGEALLTADGVSELASWIPAQKQVERVGPG